MSSYLNNHIHQGIPNNNVSNNSVSIYSSDYFALESLTTGLNKMLNDKIYITFKETFSSSTLDSISEVAPKVCSYNKEIATFGQEINLKYGILLNYTVLEVSEVPHWAEKFQVLARLNVQQKVQPTQTPAQNFAVPPLQVNVNLT